MAEPAASHYFGRARLLSRLAALTGPSPQPPDQSLAERLGTWVSFADAIPFYRVLEGGATATKLPEVTATPTGTVIYRQVCAVQHSLAEAIRLSCALDFARAKIKFPAPAAGMPVELAASFGPLHRFYLAHQREMENALLPLRAEVRMQLRDAVPQADSLFALDEQMESMFAPREQRLLASIPGLLEARCQALYAEHRQAVAITEDDPTTWTRPGGWLAVFAGEIEDVLLAELDVRLQPIWGLIEVSGVKVEQA